MSNSKHSEIDNMYLGEHAVSLDSKDRLVIPAVFRNVAKARSGEDGAGKFLVVHDRDRDVAVFYDSETFLEKVQNMGQSLKAGVSLLSEVKKVDPSGRFTPGKELLETLGLDSARDKKIIVVGCFENFELHTQEGWDAEKPQRLQAAQEFLGDHSLG